MKLYIFQYLIIMAIFMQSYGMKACDVDAAIVNIPLYELGKLEATPQNFKFVVKCLALVHEDAAKLFIKKINVGLMIPEGNAYTFLKEWNLIQKNGLLSNYWARAKKLLDTFELQDSSLKFEELLLCIKYPTRQEVCSILKIDHISPTLQNLALILKIMPLLPTDGLFASFAIISLKKMIKGDILFLSRIERAILTTWTLLDEHGFLNAYWMKTFKAFDWDQS